MIDLRLYARTLDLFHHGVAHELGLAGVGWRKTIDDFIDMCQVEDEDDRRYLLTAIGRLGDVPPYKLDAWDDLPPRDELDRWAWTFHRAWVDKFGPLYPPEA